MPIFCDDEQEGFTPAAAVIDDVQLRLGFWRDLLPVGCTLPDDPLGCEVVLELPVGCFRRAE